MKEQLRSPRHYSYDQFNHKTLLENCDGCI